jgi:hypothetical protein
VSPVEFVDLEPDGTELSVTMLAGGTRVPITYTSSTPLSMERADSLLPVGLIAAMRTRAPLVLPRPASPALLARVPRIQDVLHAFSGGELARVEVEAEAADAVPAPAGRGRGSFFGGGVDAFSTLLKHEASVTHLVFLQGFDARDPSSPKGDAARATVRAVADAMGKQLVEIETNVRDVCRHFGTRTTAWGPALACCALLLQDQFEQILIGATDTYATLIPWGTHPLLDPLFGTEALQIVHDGCEATRVEKLRRIARSQVALDHLRVCPVQRGATNCGECEKCMRTMTTLRLLGALDRSGSFPRTVNAGALARVRLPTRHSELFARQNLRLAREVGDWPVYAALSWTLHTRSKVHGLLPPRLRRALGLASR